MGKVHLKAVYTFKIASNLGKCNCVMSILHYDWFSIQQQPQPCDAIYLNIGYTYGKRKYAQSKEISEIK